MDNANEVKTILEKMMEMIQEMKAQYKNLSARTDAAVESGDRGVHILDEIVAQARAQGQVNPPPAS